MQIEAERGIAGEDRNGLQRPERCVAAAVRRLPDDFPEVRCANPQMTRDLDPFLDHVLEGARVVVIRVLGGRRGWQGGVDRLAERCRADGIAW